MLFLDFLFLLKKEIIYLNNKEINNKLKILLTNFFKNI